MTETTKCKALILDHDDTVVDSTSKIHYPAHVAYMKKIRPGYTPVDLETWFLKNFSPGIFSFMKDELKLSVEEIREESLFWQNICLEKVPPFYEGIPEILRKFRESGGIVAVVSHSMENIIRRDYETIDFQPDMIFGWNDSPSKRKPSIWPVEQIAKRFGLEKDDMILVDDLKPGMEMAVNAGIRSYYAAWSHNVPQIRDYMKKKEIQILKKPEDLNNILFGAV